MALTPEQIKGKLITRLRERRAKELEWSDVVTAIQALSSTEKSTLVQAFRNQQRDVIGRLLLAAIKARIEELAKNEADSIMTDDTLNVAELERLL